MISKPHMWPLPNELLLKTKKDEQNYLGGTKAQQANNELERNILATRARCQGAKLLGKLAGFIVQPVPGLFMPYSFLLVQNVFLLNHFHEIFLIHHYYRL